MKLIITFVLSFLAGRYVAEYGAENEWPPSRVTIVSLLAGAIVGLISGVVFV